MPIRPNRRAARVVTVYRGARQLDCDKSDLEGEVCSIPVMVVVLNTFNSSERRQIPRSDLSLP